jgi:intracellular sulfur oxidation DsrE/DsrF family protein
MRYLTQFLTATLLTTVSLVASAANEPAKFWTTPTIAGYGKIHYLADAAYKPKADQTYKVVFAISQAAKSPVDVNSALEHVARTVNLYVASGVPLKHLKFVAVIYGPATPVVLNDEQYRIANGVANPNLTLIKELRSAGVDVAVCGQAVAEHNFQYDWVDKQITLALSGLTTVTTLEHQGYGLIQQ